MQPSMPVDTMRVVMIRSHRVYLDYVAALLAAAAAGYLRWLLNGWLHDALPLVTLFGAVAFAVWLGGYGPAMVVVVLGYLACGYLFIPPRGAFGFHDPANAIGFAAYLITCSIIIGFGETMRSAQRRAREQSETLHVTLASIGDAVITTDIAGRVTFLNGVAESLTGWASETARGKPLHEVFRIINEETRRAVEDPVAKVLAEGRTVGLANRTILIARDGTERPIDDSAAPIRAADESLLGVVLVFRDVAEQRKDYDARARLAAIVEFSGDAIVSKNLEGIIQTWNASAERLFGYRPEEIVGKSVTLLIPPDHIDEEDHILDRIRRNQPAERLETIRRAKDGRRIPVSLSVSPVRDREGRVIGASKIIHDISEMVATREALANERERLATTLASIGDAVITTDAEGRVTFLNAEAERLTGWQNADGCGQPLPTVFRIINERSRQTVENPVSKALVAGLVVGLANHTLLIARNNTECPIDDSAAPIRDAHGRVLGVVLVFRDITPRRREEGERKRAEDALQQADRRKDEFLAILDRKSTRLNSSH